ncbi:MAG: response regulator [Hungatella hathewayi]|nr:response regulator [Hungatella hathewayi]
MYRVIIVDDEDYIRDLLVKNIRNSELGIEVVAVAGDGEEALEQILRLEPDIVITDISMPFMNGLELIRRMQSAGLHTKSVVISGYDEFDYAKQAISLGVKDYLLKPFLPGELAEVLQKMIQELDNQKALQQNMSLLREQASIRAGLAREKLLKDILEGRGCPDEQEKELGRDLDLDLNADFYLAGILRLTESVWDFRSQEGVEEFLMLVQDGYFSSDVRMYGVSVDEMQLAAVWCGRGGDEEIFVRKIVNGLKKVLGSLGSHYQIELTCALGRPYTKMGDLQLSYREAMAVWRGTLDSDAPIMLYGTEKPAKEEAAGNQIRDWKNQIRLSIRTGQKEEALRQLQGLMKCYASLANQKNDYISVSVGELVYAIQNDMGAAGYAREETEPSAAVRDWIQYGSLKDMKEMLEGYITKCCAVVCEHSEETKADIVVKQVKLLIDNNLKKEDLDLEWIADQVHFSASYVRQIFKQQTGEGFGEYLICKRMEQAGTLLQKTALPIRDVARECGYGNQRYFASSFKKFYGCTPTEFKKVAEQEPFY